jgi:hypothetical protein
MNAQVWELPLVNESGQVSVKDGMVKGGRYFTVWQSSRAAHWYIVDSLSAEYEVLRIWS